MDSVLPVLFLIALFIIGFLLYTLFNRPTDVKVYNELPAPAIIPVQHWGYGWRPWWRRHGRLPGLKPAPMPKPPKPIVIPGAP